MKQRETDNFQNVLKIKIWDVGCAFLLRASLTLFGWHFDKVCFTPHFQLWDVWVFVVVFFKIKACFYVTPQHLCETGFPFLNPLPSLVYILTFKSLSCSTLWFCYNFVFFLFFYLFIHFYCWPYIYLKHIVIHGRIHGGFYDGELVAFCCRKAFPNHYTSTSMAYSWYKGIFMECWFGVSQTFPLICCTRNLAFDLYVQRMFFPKSWALSTFLSSLILIVNVCTFSLQ